MKLLASIITIAAFCVALPSNVAAGCPNGSVLVDSIGGVLCVADKYVNGEPPEGVEWGDPATCRFGYYQGSCMPVDMDNRAAPTTSPTPEPVAINTSTATIAPQPVAAPPQPVVTVVTEPATRTVTPLGLNYAV